MNFTSNHRLAGHFTRARENGKFLEYEDCLVVRIVGFGRSKLDQTDINYICSFYHIPWTENWLIEGNDHYNYKVIIRKRGGVPQ